MLKEKVYNLIVEYGIKRVIGSFLHYYYSQEEIDEKLKNEKVTNVSLEGLITDTLDYKGEPTRIYNIIHSVETEDNKNRLFIEDHRIHTETPLNGHTYKVFNILLDTRKDNLTALFKEEGNNNVNISITYCDEEINNSERDSKRIDEIHKNYRKKLRERNKWLFRGCNAIGIIIGAGIVYATCFMPRTIEDTKIVSIKQEEIMNVKSGSVSKWYNINVDKHDDCLITSEEIGAGLNVGDSLKEIKWRPQIGECDYVTEYKVKE
jgi:hypothetical protein